MTKTRTTKSISIANNGKTTERSAKLVGSDNVEISKFQCSLDGGAWEDCASPSHTATFRSA